MNLAATFFGKSFELEKILGKGHLDNCIIQTHKSHIEYDIYLDTNQGFLLKYNDQPNAIFGFEINKEILMMHQLQGITGYDYWNHKKIHPKGLQNMNWKQNFLDFKIHFAKMLNLNQVGIVSTQNIPYNTPTLINNYDLLAITNNYTQRSDGNFVKRV
jgi:hypothetical protein